MNEMCISVSEMGKRLNISRAAAYALAHTDGFYPAFRFGSRVLVRVSALERWLSEQPQVNGAGKAV